MLKFKLPVGSLLVISFTDIDMPLNSFQTSTNELNTLKLKYSLFEEFSSFSWV